MVTSFQIHSVFKDNITSRPGIEEELMPKKPEKKPSRNTTNWTSWIMAVKKILYEKSYNFEDNTTYESDLYDRWRIGDDIDMAVTYIYNVKTNEKRKRKRTR